MSAGRSCVSSMSITPAEVGPSTGSIIFQNRTFPWASLVLCSGRHEARSSDESCRALLFAVVVAAWGSNWTVTKSSSRPCRRWDSGHARPGAAWRCCALLWDAGNWSLPRRCDLPVVFGVAIPHMVAFPAWSPSASSSFRSAARSCWATPRRSGCSPPRAVSAASRCTRSHLAGGAGRSPGSPSCSIRWPSTEATAMPCSATVCCCSAPRAGRSTSSMCARIDGYRRRSNSSSGRRCSPPSCCRYWPWRSTACRR